MSEDGRLASVTDINARRRVKGPSRVRYDRAMHVMAQVRNYSPAAAEKAPLRARVVAELNELGIHDPHSSMARDLLGDGWEWLFGGEQS